MKDNSVLKNTKEKPQGASFISRSLSLPLQSVSAVLTLLDEGCTIPFISRYRKERTGNLDEVQITNISELNERLEDLGRRKLTTALEKQIRACMDAAELEDIYLPYKPKRRTRAQIARGQGLEPLAALLLLQREQHPGECAGRFVKGDIKDAGTALAGASDIIAEIVSENQQARNTVRAAYRRDVEGRQEDAGHRRGAEVLGLLRLLRTAPPMQQPPPACHAARRGTGHPACKHHD